VSPKLLVRVSPKVEATTSVSFVNSLDEGLMVAAALDLSPVVGGGVALIDQALQHPNCVVVLHSQIPQELVTCHHTTANHVVTPHYGPLAIANAGFACVSSRFSMHQNNAVVIRRYTRVLNPPDTNQDATKIRVRSTAEITKDRFDVLLTGSIGAGKTFVADKLVRSCGGGSAAKISFARPLKAICADLVTLETGVKFAPSEFERQLLHDGRDRREDPLSSDTSFGLAGMSAREVLQQVGTDIMRRHLGADVFANAAANTATKKEIRVFDDLRFPEELVTVGRDQSAMAVTIRIDAAAPARDAGVGAGGAGAPAGGVGAPAGGAGAHISERRARQIPHDIVIHNPRTSDERNSRACNSSAFDAGRSVVHAVRGAITAMYWK
jgi:hypothetical protein